MPQYGLDCLTCACRLNRTWQRKISCSVTVRAVCRVLGPDSFDLISWHSKMSKTLKLLRTFSKLRAFIGTNSPSWLKIQRSLGVFDLSAVPTDQDRALTCSATVRAVWRVLARNSEPHHSTLNQTFCVPGRQLTRVGSVPETLTISQLWMPPGGPIHPMNFEGLVPPRF